MKTKETGKTNVKLHVTALNRIIFSNLCLLLRYQGFYFTMCIAKAKLGLLGRDLN